MLFQRVWLLSLAVSVVGCECRPNATYSVEGEVRWEWQLPEGPQSDASARVHFPTTTMGARREQLLFVRNVGRVAFTMAEFAKVSGSATTLGLLTEPNAAFEVQWAPNAVVNPTEQQQVVVVFAPPITEGDAVVDYAAELELRPSGAPASRLSLTGRALAGQCEVPAVIDFGSVPIGTQLTSDISLRNDGEAPVRVSAGGVTGAPVGVFEVDGLASGGLQVDANTAPLAAVKFKPTEPRDYLGEFVVRRGEACPQRTVQLRGRGVTSCLTWKADPPDNTAASALYFGSVAPGRTGPGTITFRNECSLEVQISMLRTNDPVFAVTRASGADLTLLPVPASQRDATQQWVAGTAVTELAFRPTVLGPRTGQLLLATSLPSQASLAIGLRGFGGGPRIDVRPAPVLAFGRVGYTPGASPGTFAQRTLRVANVGNRPSPADPRANLHLGVLGQGPTWWSVRALSGDVNELCVGTWDSQGNACAGSLSATQYNPADGIEAVAGAGLNVPVRVVPGTAGPKEWELTIYSDDAVTPEVTVRITADAVAAPPCNYTVAPTNLAFGILDQPDVRDLSFTFTNLGTQPSETCFFSGIDLSPTTHDTFSLPSAQGDLELAAGQSTSMLVRAQPLRPAAATPAQVSGFVNFSVSTPGASQGSVTLSATLASPCITVAPSPLNFIDTELECGSPERALTISNTCAQTVTLNSVVLTGTANAPMGSGTCANAAGCPQFNITSAPAGGAIAPGASRTVLLRYRPYLTGNAQGELTVTVQQGTTAVPYNIPLNGLGRPRTSVGCGVAVSCPAAMTVNANSTVTLAPNIMAPGAVTCAWSAAMRPSTSNGTFSAPSSCLSTNYFADVVGTHLVQITVNDGLGGTAQCNTPITVTPNGDLWIELTWDRNNDMDLHLLHPNAGAATSASSWFNNTWDCNYLTRSPNWAAGAQANPSLDRDDVAGRGPENTRITTPQPNINYTVGVHMYSWSASPTPVLSTLKVYCGGQLMTTQTRSMSRLKDMWVVGTVRFGAATPCGFTAINSIVAVP